MHFFFVVNSYLRNFGVGMVYSTLEGRTETAVQWTLKYICMGSGAMAKDIFVFP